MRRPQIGITCYVTRAHRAAWDMRAALVPWGYVEAVEAAGGRPVVLPPMAKGCDEALSRIDALVLCGGPDLSPAAYGRRNEVDPDLRARDTAEVELLTRALEQDVALLGICRGMQLLNVVRGGTLLEHLPDVVGHEGHRTRPGHFDQHVVDLAADSLAGRILGDQVVVDSSHHQGVDRLGAGLVASGWAFDGTVEAIEDPSRRFALGVLWHPQQGSDLDLFAALVSAARSASEPTATGQAA